MIPTNKQIEAAWSSHELCGDVAKFAGINRMDLESLAKYFYEDGAAWMKEQMLSGVSEYLVMAIDQIASMEDELSSLRKELDQCYEEAEQDRKRIVTMTDYIEKSDEKLDKQGKELDEARAAISISKHWCVVPECQCPLCLFLAKYPDRATGAKE